MTVEVLHVAISLHNLHARLPFRYGIAEMTAMPQLFLQATCKVNGRTATGTAADGLAPKWFTKYAHTSYEHDVAEMLEVISAAARFAEQAGPAESVFALWQTVYQAQKTWAQRTGYPPLLWNFGVSLVERALIDAFCRAEQIPFAQAVQENRLGIDLAAIHPQLRHLTPGDLLPAQPPHAIAVRHTVGMADPLAASAAESADCEPTTGDGLPCTLAENIREYGLQRFKIKLRGERAADLERLQAVKTVIERNAGEDYAFTLDGNEQFSKIEAFREFWEAARAEPELQGFLRRLLFVEQPLKRSTALSEATRAGLYAWPNRPPIIIDESDAELSSLPRALECGYAGTSHKNCKGVFKGLANACLLAYMRQRFPDQPFLLSGEDLINIGPVALMQDLAVMAVLGLAHVERNGHQYFAGLSAFPDAIQEKVLAAHGDLYVRSSAGYASLAIVDGRLSLDSILRAPFGVGYELGDLEQVFTPQSAWQFDSLQTPALP